MRRILVFAMMIMPTLSFAQDKGASDKVDLKQLEDKYWAAKDDDLGVVQNRAFTKEKRFYGSLSTGPLINDEWIVGSINTLSLGYFFNEQWGLELGHKAGALKKNDGVDQIVMRNGLQPDHNIFLSSTSLYGIWVPFYGKMSLLDRKIIYFDMQFALGVGQINYENQLDATETPNVAQTTTGISFDIAQHFFFSNHFAVRVDLKNTWSTQKLKKWRTSGTADPSTRDLSDKGQQDTTFQIGLTYFH